MINTKGLQAVLDASTRATEQLTFRYNTDIQEVLDGIDRSLKATYSDQARDWVQQVKQMQQSLLSQMKMPPISIKTPTFDDQNWSDFRRSMQRIVDRLSTAVIPTDEVLDRIRERIDQSGILDQPAPTDPDLAADLDAAAEQLSRYRPDIPIEQARHILRWWLYFTCFAVAYVLLQNQSDNAAVAMLMDLTGASALQVAQVADKLVDRVLESDDDDQPRPT